MAEERSNLKRGLAHLVSTEKASGGMDDVDDFPRMSTLSFCKAQARCQHPCASPSPSFRHLCDIAKSCRALYSPAALKSPCIDCIEPSMQVLPQMTCR